MIAYGHLGAPVPKYYPERQADHDSIVERCMCQGVWGWRVTTLPLYRNLALLVPVSSAEVTIGFQIVSLLVGYSLSGMASSVRYPRSTQ